MTRMHLASAILSITLAIPVTAMASEPIPFTYEQFEASVPHFDLEDCPTGYQAQSVFCRVSFQGDAVHLFVFSDDGDQPLVAFQTFEEDEYGLTLK